MKRPFNPFLYAIPKATDPAYFLDNFETFDEVLKRRERIIRILMRGNRQQRRLAQKFRKCRQGRRCLSYACPVCTRRFRRWLTSQQFQLWGAFSDTRLAHITSIRAKHQCGLEDLQKTIPRKLIYAYARTLKGSGLGECIVVGGIDYDLIFLDNDIENAKWQPHFHIIIADVPPKAYELLRKRSPKHPEKLVSRPNRKVTIEDRAKQFTYVLKPFHRRKSFYHNDTGHLRSERYPLKPAELRELLCHLNEFPLTAFLVLQNVRRRGEELVLDGRFVDVKSKSSPTGMHQIGPQTRQAPSQSNTEPN